MVVSGSPALILSGLGNVSVFLYHGKSDLFFNKEAFSQDFTTSHLKIMGFRGGSFIPGLFRR
jgi:hypothetical protein